MSAYDVAGVTDLALDWGAWRTVVTAHPDGSEVMCFVNTETGVMQFDQPLLE